MGCLVHSDKELSGFTRNVMTRKSRPEPIGVTRKRRLVLEKAKKGGLRKKISRLEPLKEFLAKGDCGVESRPGQPNNVERRWVLSNRTSARYKVVSWAVKKDEEGQREYHDVVSSTEH